MKKYSVIRYFVVQDFMEIEAETEQDAIAIANDEYESPLYFSNVNGNNVWLKTDDTIISNEEEIDNG